LTSLINFAAINENFPVAGQDNDTQVFRDNFDTIKNNFREAKTEIEDLQNNSARTDATSDFNYNIVSTVTLQDAVLLKRDYGAAIVAATQEVSFKQALYHIIKFGANCAIGLVDFPVTEVDVLGFGGCGKITLELYGDGTARTLTFTPTGSTVFKKSSGFPGTLTVTSATNPVIIEVWQHDANTIFLNYLGAFA
jgi:hypothetical protein